jgi:hypothetical protein
MAKLLGVSPGAIGNWKARGVPVKASVTIAGLVPAVTRQRLRPHDFHEIWPDLAVPPAAPLEGSLTSTAPLPPGVPRDRRDPARISAYAGSDIDRRAPAGEGA